MRHPLVVGPALVVGLAAVVLLPLHDPVRSPDQLVAAGARPAQHAARPPGDSSPRQVLQGRVLTVDHELGQFETAISLRWAPELSATPERLSFLTDAHTRFGPAGGGIASLSPGDDVHIVAVPHPDSSLRVVEVVKIDID